ncbi:MAG: hypothetical protein AAF583_01670 [Pseudomonadota bacterium]
MNIDTTTSGTSIIRAADKGMFAACSGAILAVYILDAFFFAAWGGDFWAVFILIGLVFRTIAVSAGISLQWVRGVKEIRLARATIRFIWIACLIVCLVPAMSFFAGGHQSNVNKSEVAGAQFDAGDTSRQGRIDRLENEIADLRSDRDSATAEARASIRAIQDEVDGMSAADNESVRKLQDDITRYTESYAARIETKQASIREIETEGQDDAVETAEETTETSVFTAVFEAGEELTGASADTTALGMLFYAAILLEVIAAFASGAYYDIHRFFQAKLKELEIEDLEHEAAKDSISNDNTATSEDEASEEEPLTDAQINGQKGFEAREHYAESRDLNKLRIPPELMTDQWGATG